MSKVVTMTLFQKYEERAKTGLFAQVDFAKELGLYPYFMALCSEQGPIVKFGDKETIMFGSNNYLSMTTNSKVKEAACKAI